MTKPQPLKGKMTFRKDNGHILCHDDEDIRSAVELRKQRIERVIKEIEFTSGCKIPVTLITKDLLDTLNNDFEDVM